MAREGNRSLAENQFEEGNLPLPSWAHETNRGPDADSRSLAMSKCQYDAVRQNRCGAWQEEPV